MIKHAVLYFLILPLIMLATPPVLLFAGSGLNDVNRVDLQGKPLATAPNPTVLPEG